MTTRKRDPRVVIVGAGMSGIAMGVALKKAGFEDFVMLEKGSDVGGTWYWNHYPGLSCDVPSQLYQYSFALKPDWQRVFATQDEILEYHRDVVDRFGLRPHLRLDTEVTAARWTGEGWEVEAGGETQRADFVVMATGVLHHPNVPDIPGLESFAGTTLHSARWDDEADFAGKRVAVIGTGSTGVQIVSAMQPAAEQVTLFTRSPQWVLWGPTEMRQPEFFSALLRRVPLLNRLVFESLMQASWLFTDVVTRPSWRRRLLQASARRRLDAIRDEELRERLTPGYEPLCKRQVVSGGFMRAIQQPNVEVVTEAIDHVNADGIVTADAKAREFDLIALATGFKAHNYMRPMDLVGRDGLTIDEAWDNGPRAYRMMAIPGFPNLFSILGPNSPVGSLPLHHAAELSSAYIVRWLERFAAGEVDSVEVTQEATAEFNAEAAAALGPTVWNTGCNSWYQREDGTIDLFPFNRATMKRMLGEPEEAHFHLRSFTALPTSTEESHG
jgi:cation diffusion facilitator CzcD-associated flavoprotein CzcO